MGRDRRDDHQPISEITLASLTLPHAEWRNRAGLDHLVRVLGDVRFVGGCVRDTLLGLPVSDIDMATTLAPETVLEYLREANINAVPTGLQHGTITAVLESGPVEITTLRRDVSTDGRHASVAFTDDWREDAARRDFTINALYADPNTHDIFDYFEGVADLDAQRVRFIGDPYERIAEDHLRILRYFRFLARFGNEPDAEALEACTRRAKDLMALSRERIREELLKLLVAKDAVRVVSIMIERDIFNAMFPEIKSSQQLAHLAAREAESGIAPDPIRRLAATLSNADTERVGMRLKVSNAQRKRLIAATEAAEGAARTIAYRSGTETAIDRLLLSNRPLSDLDALKGWEPTRLPITGGAIVARGVKAGPEVNRLMRLVEDQWVEEGFPDESRLTQITDEIVGNALVAASKA